MYRFNTVNYSSCKKEVERFCTENGLEYETSPLSHALDEINSVGRIFVETLNRGKRESDYFTTVNESRQRIENAIKDIKQFSKLTFKLKTFIEDIDESKET